MRYEEDGNGYRSQVSHIVGNLPQHYCLQVSYILCIFASTNFKNNTMFTATMSDAEIQKEARKDFFELSTKVKIAADRFFRLNCNLIDNSTLFSQNRPINLMKNSVEKRKWKTRRHNVWTSCFKFKNEKSGGDVEMLCFLYTSINRANGTEYVFQSDLKEPIAERFTMHFIERYKERHLKPHNIDIGAMPAPLYFQIHNPDPILGKYYKSSDIDIAEGKNKRFWIVPEGIYVSDYIDGMFTYITFMDKDDLSPFKKQVYEEEIVWDLLVRATNKKLSDSEQSKATFSIFNNPNLGPVFERFAKRNIKDNADGEKQKTLSYIKEQMALVQVTIEEAKKKNEQKENLSNRNSVFDEVFDESILKLEKWRK